MLQESNPNDYSRLIHSQNKTLTLCSASNPQFSEYDVHRTPEGNYECPCDGKKSEMEVRENDYDSASLPSIHAHYETMPEEVCDFTPEYHYKFPFDGKKLESKLPKNDYDTASLPSNKADEAMSEEVYDYTQSEAIFDDYDYESPYEKPSDEKTKLIKQFRKLRISSIMQKELE